MRFLPVSRRVHTLEVAHRDARIADLERQVTYWRSRAERLDDAALARAGAIHEPTMVERAITHHGNQLSRIVAAATMTEFDSSKNKGVA